MTTAAPRSVDVDRSMRPACRTAGAGSLLMVPLAGFGNLVAVQGLMTSGEAGRTARDVLASEGVFRLGIVSLFAAFAAARRTTTPAAEAPTADHGSSPAPVRHTAG